MLSDADFDTFVRTPFAVRATKITEDNMEELARMIGEVRMKNDEPYIALDRRVVPNIPRAYVGWWVTALGGNIRCYSPKVFKEQFMAMPEGNSMTFDFPDEEFDLPFLFEKHAV